MWTPTRTRICPAASPLRQRDCCCERAGSGREREEERIALRVDLDATLGDAGVPDHSPMLGERVRVRLCAEFPQQARRALDVREEERHGSRWEPP